MTGIGAVSAWGWGADRLWRGLVSGRTAIARTRRFDTHGQRTHIAGEVPRAPDEWRAVRAPWRDCSRADRFAIAAATEAWRQAGWPELPQTAPPPTGTEIGVFFGGSTAGMAEGEAFFQALHEGRPRKAHLRQLVSHQLDNPGDAVARQLAATGPVRSFSSACASGALALGAAFGSLRSGEVEAAIAGGADSLCLLTYSGFNSLRAVDSRPCRPFRRDRNGLSLGEGSGVLFLETLTRARERGAEPLAEILGVGASCDAHHMTAPDPRGRGAALAIERALKDAALTPDAVGFINAHGTGTLLNDAAEWAALEQVFGAGSSEIPVTSTKGSVGHLLGSSGAIEAVATVQCLAAGQVHPTPGEGPPDEALAVDLVTERPRTLQPAAGAGGRTLAISMSFGFGGANAALVFANWPGGPAF